MPAAQEAQFLLCWHATLLFNALLRHKGALYTGRCNANVSVLVLLQLLVHGLNSAVASTKYYQHKCRNLVHEPLLRESALQPREEDEKEQHCQAVLCIQSIAKLLCVVCT